mgnify:FL=1
MAITTTTTTYTGQESRWTLVATAAGADQFSACCDNPADYAVHTSLPAETVMGERRDVQVPYRFTASESGDKLYIRCGTPGGYKVNLTTKLA